MKVWMLAVFFSLGSLIVAQAAPMEKTPPVAPAPAAVPASAAVNVASGVAEDVPMPPEDAPVTPAAPAVAKQIEGGPSDLIPSEWSFLESAAKASQSKATDQEIIENLKVLLEQNPDNGMSAQAQFLLASLYQKQGNYNQAMVAYLHLIYEYPDAGSSLQAQSAFLDLEKKRLPNELRIKAQGLVQVESGGDRDKRLALMLEKLSADFGGVLYDPIVKEYRRFQARFPQYSDMDQVQWGLVELQEASGNYQAALLGIQQLLAIYPDSGLKNKAKYELGVVYEDLGDYNKAVGAYQEYVAEYNSSPNAVAALVSIARIFTENLKQYDLALKTDDMILARAAKGPGAAAALYSESTIYDCKVLLFTCRLNDPAKAFSIYQKIVDSDNLQYLDKSSAEQVRKRINYLKTHMPEAASAAAPAPAAPASN